MEELAAANGEQAPGEDGVQGTSNLAISEEYVRWLASLKAEIQPAHTRAVLAVKQEMVRLYHRLGKEVLEQQGRLGWGPRSSSVRPPTRSGRRCARCIGC